MKHSLYSQAGFLLNDDRASGGKRTEADVLICEHCQHTLIGSSWRDDGGWCGRCGAPVCGSCADRMQTEGCTPFVRKIEEALDPSLKHRHLVSMALPVGKEG